MSKKKGQETSYRGVLALGAGRYRVRVYWTDPVTGKQGDRVKIVEAKSAKEANCLREWRSFGFGTRPVGLIRKPGCTAP